MLLPADREATKLIETTTNTNTWGKERSGGRQTTLLEVHEDRAQHDQRCISP